MRAMEAEERSEMPGHPGVCQSVPLAEIGLAAFATHPIARRASLLRYVADADRVRSAAAALLARPE